MASLDAILESIRHHFDDNFTERGEVGAALSIWMGEDEVCSVNHGFRDQELTTHWDEDTLVPIWSATKGPAAATTLLALHGKGLSPQSPIGEVWPELAGGALVERTLGELLSHQCGLCALDDPPSITDYDAVIDALNRQSPAWGAGEGHGYHPRTFGFIADELVRRTAGMPLGQFWRNRIADPLQLDVWIELPEELDGRVAEMLPARGAVEPDSAAFYKALGNGETLTNRAFQSPRGLSAVSEINQPENRRHSLPSMGAIASARGLAKFYALLATGGRWASFQFLPPEICTWAEQSLSDGEDRVLLTKTAFSAGFMKDPRDQRFGNRLNRFGASPRAFGHPGAGGSHAFADPDNHIGFAYVMNQMVRGVLPTEKAVSLVQPLYEF